MKLTPKELQQSHDDYAAAYAEDEPVKTEQSEDQAFGLAPEDAATEGEQPASAEAEESPAVEAATESAEGDTAAEGEPAGETAMEAAGDKPGTDEGEPREGAEESTGGTAEADTNTKADGGEANAGEPALDIDKEMQKLKSWEGRLKKAAADLEAKGVSVPKDEAAAGGDAPVADAIEQVADKAEGEGDAALANAADKAADKVESGELTAEQAMKQLAEDFGEDFVRMIEVIAKSHATAAGESAATAKVGELGQAVDDIIAEITDTKARTHFEKIHEAHPDFMEVGKSEGFKQYIDQLPEAEQASAKQIVDSGSAKQIVKLIGDYKAFCEKQSPEQQADDHKPAADPAVDAQMDAAEGVRSSGMALPEQPKASSNTYEDAWKEFS